MAGVGGPGRKKGVPNKNKQALWARLDREFPGWNPVVQMAEAANNPELTFEQRISAAKEAAKYLVPQLKAVEVSGPDGGAIDVVVNVIPHEAGDA